jgi:hypothetical protein
MEVKVKVTLRLTVSQSDVLVSSPNMGLLTRDFFFFESFSLDIFYGVHLFIMLRITQQNSQVLSIVLSARYRCVVTYFRLPWYYINMPWQRIVS